jgi:hypothetical protein
MKTVFSLVVLVGTSAAFGQSTEPVELKVWCSDGRFVDDRAAVIGTVTIQDEPYGSVSGRASGDFKIRRFSRPDDPNTFTEETIHAEGTGVYGGMGTEWAMRLHLRVPGAFSEVCTDESRVSRLDLEYSTQKPETRGRVGLCGGEALFSDCSWTALANQLQ